MNGKNSGGSRWSLLVWACAVLVWLAPLAAMQFTTDIHWTPFDFAVFGAMLLCAAGAFEVTVRLNGNGAYRAAMGLAILAAFLLVWANLAVGWIGDPVHPANLLFGGLLAVLCLGGFLVAFRARGMAWVTTVVAAGQVLAGLAGVIGFGAEPLILAPTLVFTLMWLVSAWLFGRAVRTPLARPVA